MAVMQFSDSFIYNYTNDPRTFQKGCAYYLKNRVYNFSYDSELQSITANISGNNEYEVHVALDHNARILSSSCTCPAYYNGQNICKHIVAVLKTAQKEIHKPQHSSSNTRKTIDRIFSYFGNIFEESQRDLIKLQVIYSFDHELGTPTSSIELRIGTNRLYYIKNIKEFIHSLDHLRPIELGKMFTFDPAVHTFTPHAKKIIALIREMYENEELINSSSITYTHTGSFFKGKRLYLSDSVAERLFEILKGHSFDAYILGNELTDAHILCSDLPLEFTLQHEEPKLFLTYNRGQFPLPLTARGTYYFYNGSIYCPSKEQQNYLPVFFHGDDLNQWKDLSFHSDEKERFVSEVLPFLQQIAEVQVDDNVQQILVKEEMQAKILFDKHESGINARVEFHYGDSIVNPFAPKRLNSENNNRILVRDTIRERNILKIFEEYDFKVEKEMVYLSDEEMVFEFIYTALPALQKLCEIYYSEAFKNIRIRDLSSISGGVRLSETSDMLEFTFHIENVENDELEQLFHSISLKKKFYRLKDGSFLPLEMPLLNSISGLIDQISMDGKDFSGGSILLPAYRAAYLDEKIHEAELLDFERNQAFKQMVHNIREPKDLEYAVPDELKNILRDYQKVGFKWLKTLAHYGFGGILADDMGLGKTLQVIAFVLSEKSYSKLPALVIAPTSLVYNWMDEVDKFAPELKVAVISGVQEERQLQLSDISGADLVITSYPLIRRDIELYSKLEFSYCFLDEAQHIKNPNTINAKSVKQINAKGYFALTGTPIENSLTELWSIFDFIMPGYLLSHNKFVKRFESPIIKDSDEKALRELTLHIKPFILRRMKSEVLKELPDKIESKMTAEMTGAQKKLYLAYLLKAKGELAKEISEHGFDKSQMKILAALTRLRQICCHPSLFVENYEGESGKLALLEEILEDAVGSRHRILLFSQFTSMLDIIKKLLDDRNISYFYLDGATKAIERNRMVKQFNEGEGSVFLISLKAGGTGLNLTGADMVIHFDPWWNPSVEDQATDRAYRIGQENVVQVIKLITQGTIEEKIFALQQRKKSMIESVIQPGETMLSKMSQDEIMNLFDIQ